MIQLAIPAALALKSYRQPLKQHRLAVEATRWWQAAEAERLIKEKEAAEADARYKTILDINKTQKKNFVEMMARLDIRYRYRSGETRIRKRSHYEYVKITAELIGTDYLQYAFSLPQGKRPSQVLDQEFQDNLRVLMNRPDMQIIATPEDGLYAYLPLKGSTDGIPNVYEWHNRRSTKDAMGLLPSNAPFALPIGMGSNRHFYYFDPTNPKGTSPHLLTGGTTGGGKSNIMNGFICSLITRNTPEACQMVMIDLKYVELDPYREIPHLWDGVGQIIKRNHQVEEALQAVFKEMERRLEQMQNANCRNINDFNAKHAPMSRLFVIIDELALVIQSVGKKAEDLISQLAALGRAAGIHLLVFTQRPSVDVVTGLIKTNMPDRLAFNTDEQGSKTILYNTMAKGLTPKGRAIFYSGGEYASVQTPLIYPHQIDAAIAHAMRWQPPPRQIRDNELLELLPQAGGNLARLVQLGMGVDPTLTPGQAREIIRRWHYSPERMEPLVRLSGSDDSFLLWGQKLVKVRNPKRPPRTMQDIEELEVLWNG